MALPLAGAGTASAAIAGANPASTNLLPDLRSATVTAGSQVQYCFDKQLGRQTALTPSDFTVAGYRSGVRLAGSVANFDNANLNCVLVTFFQGTPPSSPDYSAFSIAEAAGGAVQSATGNTTSFNGGQTSSIPDAVALNQGGGDNPQSGTRGHTTGPDLTGTIIDSSNNRIYYVFDQGVDSTIDETGFHFVQINGTVATGLPGSAIYSGNVVGVTFGATDNVNAAQRVYVDAGSVVSQNTGATASDGTPNPLGSAIVPGKSGTVQYPQLNSAALVNPGPANGGNQVDFTFDQTVSNIGNASAFTVYASNGITYQGQSAVLLADNKTVRVTFATNTVQEYLVAASADNTAVSNTNTGPSIAGGAPIGGNAGAFANGFTTGPDAFSVAFDNNSGAATVTFDQRVQSTDGGGSYILLDADGNQLSTATTVALPGFGNTGPTQVTAQFTPQSIALAKSILVTGNGPDAFGSAAITALPSDDANNVTQALAPTATSSVLHGKRLVRAKKARHVSAKVAARRVARVTRGKHARKHARGKHARKHARRHAR